MPSAATVRPSETAYTVTRTLSDPDPSDQIDVTSVSVTSVNGSAPASAPDWFSYAAQDQETSGRRAVREVDFTFDITGLRANGVNEFVVTVEASDGKTTTSHTYDFVVDDLTRSSGRRLYWLDVSAQAFMGQDTDAGTEPFYLRPWDRRQANPSTGYDWKRQMNNGLMIDADEGVLFYLEKPDRDQVKLERTDIGGGGYVGIFNRVGWQAMALDRKNKRVYAVMNRGYLSGQGLYRFNYAGGNRTKVSSLFADGAEALAIDPNGSTLILAGHDMMEQEFSLVKTDISSPDRSVSERVPESGGTNPGGYVWSIAVDWTNGWVFAIERDRRYLVKRQLSDFSQTAEHDFGFNSDYQVGLAADPVAGRVYVQWEQEILSAPYGDLSNQTVEQTEWVAWPAVAVESGTNAPPIYENRSDVEWRG